jgi:hypothetical protein
VRALFLLVFFVLAIGSATGAREKAAVRNTTPVAASAWSQAARGTIDPRVLDLALGAVQCAVRSGAVTDPATLTVIDYSKPSTEKRLWVFDLQAHELLYEELVAHGQGSGDNVATCSRMNPIPMRRAWGCS